MTNARKEMSDRLMLLENRGDKDCEEAGQLREILDNGFESKEPSIEPKEVPRYPTVLCVCSLGYDHLKRKQLFDILGKIPGVSKVVAHPSALINSLSCVGIPNDLVGLDGVTHIGWKEIECREQTVIEESD